MESELEYSISGTKDMFPEYHKYLTFLKKVFRHEFRKNGFRRITPSSLESLDLLRRVYPEGKNRYGIYNFQDQSNQSIGLSPTASVGVMRAYLENEKYDELQPVYYYYMERFFRQSRNRKEYFSIGGEVIGESDPIIDAQNLYMVYSALKKMGLADNLKVRINTYGNHKEMTKFYEELVSFFENKKGVMSPETQEAFTNDLLAPFYSNDEDDMILAQSAPDISKFLKKDTKKYYADFLSYLDDLEVPYSTDHTLFFPEGTYSHSIWQIETQDGEKIANGGRYDNLAKDIGSPKDYGSAGFGVDADKLISILQGQGIHIKDKDQIDLYFVQLGDEAKRVVFPLSLEARARGINTQTSLGTPSMKEQMLKAQRIGATYVVLVGLMEARNGIFQVRNTRDGTQEEVKKEDIIDYIIGKIGDDHLDFYEPSRDLLQGEVPEKTEKKL